MSKLIIFLLFACIVGAAAGQVIILNLEYDNGKITILDTEIRYGYAPDYKLAPDSGYRLEIVGVANSELYSLNFRQPIHYIDAEINGTLTGGAMAEDKAEFSIVVPYFREAKQLRIYSEENKVIAKINYEKNAYLIPLAVAIILLAVIVITWLRKRST